MEYLIRSEEEKDHEQVRHILQAAFSTDAESKLVDALRANGKVVIALVAVCGEDVFGHILFSPVTSHPPTDVKGLGLAPVAVHPYMQSKGIGSELIRQGLLLCQSLGYDYCVVLGSPDYYRRFGFETASDIGLGNEYGVDEEFMVIRFSDRFPSGLIQYAHEFRLFSL